ncbi:MAG: Gfo/Idh/MocA family oxidoreductase [Paracoccaceae bacterium]|nr:Gfo/Idh/MocA family oxidoreductase [Paracoccaceae bacterium]
MINCIKMCAVGTGYFSQFHFDAWSRLGVNLKGVCSLNLKDAKKVANNFSNCQGFSDYQCMMDTVKPNLIDIIVPPSEQFSIMKEAIDRGINIICQKPFTTSLSEAEKVLDMASTADVRIIVHENFRFQPWHVQIKGMLDQNLIGDPYQVSVRMRPGDGQGADAYLNRQPYFQKMKRFLIHETAIHFIDLFRYYFGEIESVFADLVQLNPNILGEDAGFVIFKFKNGVRGLFDGNRLSDHIAEDRRRTIGDFLVEGSNGSIRLNGDGDIFYRCFGSNSEKKVDYQWDDKGFAGDSVYFCQKNILDSILSGEVNAHSGLEYLKNLKIEETIYISNENGERQIIVS